MAMTESFDGFRAGEAHWRVVAELHKELGVLGNDEAREVLIALGLGVARQLGRGCHACGLEVLANRLERYAFEESVLGDLDLLPEAGDG